MYQRISGHEQMEDLFHDDGGPRGGARIRFTVDEYGFDNTVENDNLRSDIM